MLFFSGRNDVFNIFVGLCEYHNRHVDDSFHNERDRSRRVERYTLGSSDNVDPEEWHWNDWQYNVCMVEWVKRE